MRWTVGEVEAATGGRLLGAADHHVGDLEAARSSVLEGVTQDSRETGPGMLFVPLAAERDGHDFIAHAVTAGARAYLTARGRCSDRAASSAAAAIEVDDTQRALTDLGREARRRLGDRPVIAVTGSAGKTTTKDLLAAVLGRDRRVHASSSSFNNEIGVPLTLLSAPDDVDAAIVEMGASGLGHIAGLCALASPTMGVVTTVGLAHTSEFGSLEAVAAGKGELVEALPSAAEGGVAFLNAGVAQVAAMASRTTARVVTYGDGGEVAARGLTLDDDLTPRFILSSPRGEVAVRLGARGLHAVDDALAAAAVALELGSSLSDVAAGLAEPLLSPLRMALVRTARGARLLNDCYNANPLSMRAALRALAALPARRRIAVLGVMAELGDFEAEEHSAASALAAALGVLVVAVDAPGYASQHADTIHVEGIDGAAAALRELGGPADGDAVLVKGSRVAGLERLVERLADV